MKIFICFPKEFFLQNDFIDTMNAILTVRQRFFLPNYWKWSKKSPQKMQKLFEKFSWNCSHGEVKSSLKAPLTFLDSQAKYFRSKFKKITICRFCKRLAPKSLHWNWESNFDNSATFFARIGQKKCSVSKNEKENGNETLLR